MTPVEKAAWESVARACGFAALGMGCVVLGFSFEPLLALRLGGVLALVMALVLGVLAWMAPHRPYKRTEAWLALRGTSDAPPRDVAQRLIGGALAEAYGWFARLAAAAAMAFFAVAFLVSLL